MPCGGKGELYIGVRKLLQDIMATRRENVTQKAPIVGRQFKASKPKSSSRHVPKIQPKAQVGLLYGFPYTLIEGV